MTVLGPAAASAPRRPFLTCRGSFSLPSSLGWEAASRQEVGAGESLWSFRLFWACGACQRLARVPGNWGEELRVLGCQPVEMRMEGRSTRRPGQSQGGPTGCLRGRRRAGEVRFRCAVSGLKGREHRGLSGRFSNRAQRVGGLGLSVPGQGSQSPARTALKDPACARTEMTPHRSAHTQKVCEEKHASCPGI